MPYKHQLNTLDELCVHTKCEKRGTRRYLELGWVCNTHAARMYRSGVLEHPRDFETETTRYCTKCKQYLALDQFRKVDFNPRGMTYVCQLCQRDYYFDSRMLRCFGWPRGTYKKVLDAQDGTCAVCDATTKLCVDHDHKTGRARGILCDDHNNALGRVHDNIEELQRLIDYLTEDTCERLNLRLGSLADHPLTGKPLGRT